VRRRRSQETEVRSQNEKRMLRVAENNGQDESSERRSGGFAKKGKLRNEAKRSLWLNGLRFLVRKTKPKATERRRNISR
jgi:hypothetical protein